MIKYEFSKKHVSMEVCGDAAEVAAQAMFMLDRIYTAVKKQDADAAERFKNMIVTSVTEKDSPMWTGMDLSGEAMLCVVGGEE